MKFGLFDMIGLAATLAFALPVANFGVWRLMDGDHLFGGAMIVVAVAMVVLPQFFFDPGRILRGLLRGLLPARLRDDESADDDGVAGDAAEK